MVVRNRQYSGHRWSPEEVLADLRAEHFSGKVTVFMSEGGVMSIEAEDRATLPLTCNNNHV